MPDQPRFLHVESSNIQREHICCALSGAKHAEGVKRKKEFLAAGFAGGLVFRKLDVQGKVFVEYAPAEAAWRPVVAPGCLVIHCLWVSGRYKGQGFGGDLLQHCIEQGKQYSGVVAVAGSAPFLTETAFYVRHGFEVVDRASGFDLVYHRASDKGPSPRFGDAARRGRVPQKEGVHLEFCHQCPFVPDTVAQMSLAAEQRGLKVTTRRLASAAEAQQAASPFGTFGVFLFGELLTHEMMTTAKFDALLARTLAKKAQRT